jgi:hypothetical protein
MKVRKNGGWMVNQRFKVKGGKNQESIERSVKENEG